MVNKKFHFIINLLMVNSYLFAMQANEQKPEQSKVPSLKILVAQTLTNYIVKEFSLDPSYDTSNLTNIVALLEQIPNVVRAQENHKNITHARSLLSILHKPVPMCNFTFPPNIPHKIDFSSDESHMIVTEFNHKSVFNIQSQKRHYLERCKKFDCAYQTSSNGHYLCDTHAGIACIWDLNTYAVKEQMESNAVVFCDQSKYVAKQDKDNLKVYTLDTNELVCYMPAWAINGSCLTFSPDNSLIAVMGNRDQDNISIFRLPKGSWCGLFSGKLISFNSDGSLLAVVALESKHSSKLVLKLYETSYFKQEGKWNYSFTMEPSSVVFSTNGKRIATQFQNGWYEIIDIGREFWFEQLQWDINEAYAELYSSQDKYLYIHKRTGILEVRDFEKNILYHIAFNRPIITAHISPGQTYIIVHDEVGWHLCHGDDSHRKWDMSSEREPVLSPQDTYCFAWHQNNKGTLFVLNLFKHAKPTFAELMALMLLSYQQHKKEVEFDDNAIKILDASENYVFKRIYQWLYCKRIICDVCRQHVQSVECILPCGHAQFHEVCLEKNNKICSLCK